MDRPFPWGYWVGAQGCAPFGALPSRRLYRGHPVERSEIPRPCIGALVARHSGLDPESLCKVVIPAQAGIQRLSILVFLTSYL